MKIIARLVLTCALAAGAASAFPVGTALAVCPGPGCGLSLGVTVPRLGATVSDLAGGAAIGAQIASLQPGSPLLGAPMVGGGIYVAEVGDIILAVNGVPVSGAASLLQLVSAGGPVLLTIFDARHSVTVQVSA